MLKKYRFGKLSRYLRSMLCEHKEIKSFMISKKKFIKPGNYKMLSLGKTIIYKDSAASGFMVKQAMEFSSKFPLVKYFLKRVLSNLFRISVRNHEVLKEEKYKGDFILFTQANNVKVFNRKHKVVLNFISGVQLYEQLKKTYAIFKLFFNIPIKGFCDEQQIIIESYIDFKVTKHWSKQEKESVLKDYCARLGEYLDYCVSGGGGVY